MRKLLCFIGIHKYKKLNIVIEGCKYCFAMRQIKGVEIGKTDTFIPPYPIK